MHYKSIIYLITSFLLLSGCSDSTQEVKNETPQKKALKIIEATPAKTTIEKVVETKVYTIDEIYNSMCIECHSSDGSGNTEKLTPSMAHLSEQEMIAELQEIEADEGHIIMEHNRGKIIKMGMEYKAEDMAAYMFKRFNK